jgi:signal peptidase II
LEVILKETIRSLVLLFALGGIVIALDQLTKMIVRTQLEFGESWVPWDWLSPYVRIVYWHNSGAAFGMLQNMSTVFTILAIIVASAIIVYYPQIPKGDWPLRVALGLQFGGAVGNLIDRLTIGYVTDFISVGNFPVFNIADSAISIGVAVLILGMWIMERKQKTNQTDQEASRQNQETPFSEEEYLGE